MVTSLTRKFAKLRAHIRIIFRSINRGGKKRVENDLFGEDRVHKFNLLFGYALIIRSINSDKRATNDLFGEDRVHKFNFSFVQLWLARRNFDSGEEGT